MASDNSSTDETIEVSALTPEAGDPESAPPQAGTVLDETVKMEAWAGPCLASEPYPPGIPQAEGTLEAGQGAELPSTPVDAPDTQPTVRVDVAPISETQPTVPILPPAPVEEATVRVAVPQPAALASDSAEPPPFIRRGARWSLSSLSGWHAIAAGGVAILLILACTGSYLTASKNMASLGPFQFATLTPSPTATPTQAPATATLPPSPTLPPTHTPLPATSTPALPLATETPVRPPPTALEVGVQAKVTPPEGSPLNVRATAGIGGELVGKLQKDAQVKIVDGPVEANDLTWWKIDDGAGLVGWSAAGAGGVTYLEPLAWAP
ncbi:MAG: SH3 domain-containing protein [Thermoflexales bacterium]|nr:SH3 domain-containing protein [Thermoflexales bacterium]